MGGCAGDVHACLYSVISARGPVLIRVRAFLKLCIYTPSKGRGLLSDVCSQSSCQVNLKHIQSAARTQSQAPRSRPFLQTLLQVAARSPRLRQLNPSSNLIWQSQAWREAGRDLTKMTFLAIRSRELSFNREPLLDRHQSFCTLLMRYWFETMHHQILLRLAPW